MIHKKENVINEMITRKRLRHNCTNSFKKFLQYMVPEFFTDYKFECYLEDLSKRLEALIKKQKLVRETRQILNNIYHKQNEFGQLSNYGFVKTKLYHVLLACFTIKLSYQKKILYKKLKQICDLDDKVFFKPNDDSLKSLIMKTNFICDNAKLKLMISLPPGAGKTLITTLLSIWVIGLDDNYINGSVMRNSYSMDMAETMSRAVRDFVDSDKYQYIFPHVKLAYNRKNVKGWSVADANELTYFGSGPGGSVSGKRAKTLAIYDDFCKGMKEAMSQAELNDTWLFYTSVHIKRMISGTAELIIGTRYVKNDLIGKVLEKQDHLWEVIKKQAIINVENEFGELVEKSFCEEIHTTQEYLSEREVTDPNVWNAVAQQNPVSSEGLLFPEEELLTFGLDELHDINYKVGFCDTADEGVDYLAAIILASKRPSYRKYEWDEIVKKYTIINEWENEWYEQNEYGEVYVNIKKLPQVDSRIPVDLRLKMIAKFRMTHNFYLIDVVFSQKGTDYTQSEVANLIIEHNPNEFTFESNKEGKSYAREIENIIYKKCYTIIKTEDQHSNKETRIMNAAPRIKKYIYFRNDYSPNSQYAEFMAQLCDMVRMQKNQSDDSGDVLSLAAENIFNLSDKFFDVLSIEEEEKMPKPQSYGTIDDEQYDIYMQLKNFKQITVLRLKYIDIIRNYMIELLNVFHGDRKIFEHTKNEIIRLDNKFYGRKLDIVLNGDIIA